MIAYIPGMDHKYAVSEEGIVYHVKNGSLHEIKNDISTGYARVRIFGKHYQVSKLVATTFIPKPYPGLILVGHKDNDILNNNVRNLYWCNMSMLKRE